MFKEIVDLSHELFNNMPGIYSNVATFWAVDTHAKTSTRSQGEISVASGMLLIHEHISTHFDAPYHFDPNGLTAEKVPLERLVVPGHLLDFTSKGVLDAITPEDLATAEQRSGKPIARDTAVIAWTGDDVNWGKPNFSMERPYLPPESAHWLAAKGISLFGTDLIGIDHPDDWRWTTHQAFLKSNVPMVQQLCNLGALQGKEFLLAVLPLKIRDSTGGPVRAVGLVL